VHVSPSVYHFCAAGSGNDICSAPSTRTVSTTADHCQCPMKKKKSLDAGLLTILLLLPEFRTVGIVPNCGTFWGNGKCWRTMHGSHSMSPPYTTLAIWNLESRLLCPFPFTPTMTAWDSNTSGWRFLAHLSPQEGFSFKVGSPGGHPNRNISRSRPHKELLGDHKQTYSFSSAWKTSISSGLQSYRASFHKAEPVTPFGGHFPPSRWLSLP
jgi:hypothetical protein